MDEDDGKELTFDEVFMQDIIEDWCRHYTANVEVDGWYYDPFKQVVLIRMFVEYPTDEE